MSAKSITFHFRSSSKRSGVESTADTKGGQHPTIDATRRLQRQSGENHIVRHDWEFFLFLSALSIILGYRQPPKHSPAAKPGRPGQDAPRKALPYLPTPPMTVVSKLAVYYLLPTEVRYSARSSVQSRHPLRSCTDLIPRVFTNGTKRYKGRMNINRGGECIGTSKTGAAVPQQLARAFQKGSKMSRKKRTR